MTIAELQKEFLSSGGKGLAPEDFFILLAHATGKEKTFLLSHPEYAIGTENESRARDFFARRLSHEPVASITGHKEFYGLDFSVTQDTLIPRPETELLVALALEQLTDDSQTNGKITVIDVGTGSGNIIISIASELMKSHPQFTLHATDISQRAVAVAKQNAQRHGVDDSITFHSGDLLEPLTGRSYEDILSADQVIIVANLPYLSEAIYQASDDDVKKFEPRSALLSGSAGLDHYCRLLTQIQGIAKPITLYLEISPEQTPLLENRILARFPQAKLSFHQDLSGRERAIMIRVYE